MGLLSSKGSVNRTLFFLENNGFKMKKRYLIFTEPFKKNKLSDPKKIWPVTLDQNIWAEK